jgi:hypothetical protein
MKKAVELSSGGCLATLYGTLARRRTTDASTVRIVYVKIWRWCLYSSVHNVYYLFLFTEPFMRFLHLPRLRTRNSDPPGATQDSSPTPRFKRLPAMSSPKFSAPQLIAAGTAWDLEKRLNHCPSSNFAPTYFPHPAYDRFIDKVDFLRGIGLDPVTSVLDELGAEVIPSIGRAPFWAIIEGADLELEEDRAPLSHGEPRRWRG